MCFFSSNITFCFYETDYRFYETDYSILGFVNYM